jgi:hypothetical protein
VQISAMSHCKMKSSRSVDRERSRLATGAGRSPGAETVALFRRCSQDSDAVDAGRKGITGDLFEASALHKPTAVAKPPPAVPAKTLPTIPEKLQPDRLKSSAAATPTPASHTTPATPGTAPSTGTARRPRPTAVAHKLPAYFYRLPLREQRRYLASDSIDRFPLTPSSAALATVAGLMTALDGGAPSIVQRASQTLLNEVCRLLAVRPVRLEVRSVRPRNSRGELHGLFYPRAPIRPATVRGGASSPSGQPLIVLWMRTAQRHDVVKPRTFLRTLMHELGHYLDYALLKLEDSYHSGGFYQRESFLVRTLCPAEASPPRSK